MKVKREEAKGIINGRVKVTGTETKVLDEAYGRVIAQDVVSPVDIPDQDKSAIDGFAFNTASLTELPARLKVVGEIPAGSQKKFSLKRGEAAFVMTGGVIPEGSNAAVRIEDVKVEGDELVIDFPVKEGNLVNFRGSEIRKGERVIKRGELLDYRKVGLLAHLGVYRIKVFQRVKVGIVTTGTEVLEPEEPFRKGAVRNTNFYTLKGLLESLGAEVVYVGKGKDNVEELKELIAQSLSTCDFTVTTGGISKGKYDLVREVIRELGVEILFTQTDIRPGRPLTFGVKGDKLFFGLPGYPAACLVNALEFLVPAVKKAMGIKEFQNRYVTAVAGDKLKSRKGRVDFVRVKLSSEEGVLKVYPESNQQTSNFLTVVKCQGLAVIGRERENVEKGETVEVLLFNNPFQENTYSV